MNYSLPVSHKPPLDFCAPSGLSSYSYLRILVSYECPGPMYTKTQIQQKRELDRGSGFKWKRLDRDQIEKDIGKPRGLNGGKGASGPLAFFGMCG